MGMILDGIAASEQPDSSAEIVSIKGCDISDLTAGRGTLNWEHLGEKDPGHSANDHIGRIAYAKKIFTRGGCENARQREYWDFVQVPYIYIKAELFNDEGHPGAISAAAMIRHYRNKGLPILVRYSIEGSTLEQDGPILKRSIARRIAATIKPANKSAISGVLADGDSKKVSETSAVDDPLAFLVGTKKHEHPDQHRLGFSPTIACDPELDAVAELTSKLAEVKKSITAGGYNAAPGGLTGGSALQREELHGLHDVGFRNKAKAALRDYDPDTHGEFKKYIKHQLPEASDSFIERFADAVGDWKVTRAQILSKAERVGVPDGHLSYMQVPKGSGGASCASCRYLSEDGKQCSSKFFQAWNKGSALLPYPADESCSDWYQPREGALEKVDDEEVAEPSGRVTRFGGGMSTGSTAFKAKQKKYQKKLGVIKEKRAQGSLPGMGDTAPAMPPAETPEFKVHLGKRLSHGEAYFDHGTGTLHTADGRFRVYIPKMDDRGYGEILNDPELNRIHDTAIQNWYRLHKVIRSGKVPPEMVALASLFSAMSPNCLDVETEALTKRGWVPGFELQMNDEILTKNPHTNALEWQFPTDLRFFPDYEGPLVELKSRSFHVVTTPEHRWLVTTGRGHVREKTSLTIALDNDRIHRTGEYRPDVKSGLTPDEAELLGWFVTDGFVRRPGAPSCTAKKSRAFLVQSPTANPEKCFRIDALLGRLGPSGRAGDWTRYHFPKDTKYVWRLGPRLTTLLLSRCPNRTLTVQSLLDLDRPALVRLREAVQLGDGTRGSGVLNTGRKEQADAFQALVTMTGSCASLAWRDMSKYEPRSSKLNNVPKMTGIYLVSEQKRKFARIEEGHRREFVGRVPVWCPVVPNSFFVVRRRGQVFVTGNTAVPIQELAYGHLQDLMGAPTGQGGFEGFDPTKELSRKEYARYAKEFQALVKGQKLPAWERDHFAHQGSGIWTKEGRRYSIGLGAQKWRGAKNYHEIHKTLVDLVNKHGVDARGIAAILNDMKVRAGTKHQGEDPEVKGFAPKTIRYLLGMMGLGNIVVPDTHFIRHTFGLHHADPKSDVLKKYLWNEHNEPLLAEIDKYYMANHPAVAHTRAKMQKMFGEDLGEQALFPAFWLHWLIIQPHERRRGWFDRGQAKNAETDHAVFWNAVKRVLDKYGIPHDHRLIKSEYEGDGSMAARVAHATKELEHQFGYVPATLALYAAMVPAVLAHREPLAKAEQLTAQLQSLAKAEKKQEKPQLYPFKGRAVLPGELEIVAGPQKGNKHRLLDIGAKDHHILADSGSLMRVKADSPHYRINSKPVPQGLGYQLVDAIKHGVPGLAQHPDQQELIHGMDLSADALPRQSGQAYGHSMAMFAGETGWRRSHAGHVSYVKPAFAMDDKIRPEEQEGFSTAHREAAFHHLAKNFFKLGQHVPTTAAFHHPVSGLPYSAAKMVEHGEHYEPDEPTHNAAIASLRHTGTLDKMALMDMVLGNTDRHLGNFMLTPQRAPYIHLIDNGLTFPNSTSEIARVPDYWQTKDVGENWNEEPLHPEAVAWAQKLDPAKLDKMMEDSGVPTSSRAEAVYRLTALKNRISRGRVTKGGAFYSPFMGSEPRRGTTEDLVSLLRPSQDEEMPFGG